MAINTHDPKALRDALGGSARACISDAGRWFAQGVYYTVTGVVPFVSRDAFEAVTGPKREWWLVQTVAALVTAVGGGLLGASVRDRATPELVAIAAGCAAGLAGIDVVYVVRRRISPVYLGDAAVQLAVLAGLAHQDAAGAHRPC